VKEYPTDQIRNVCLIGHGLSGKTSLAEAMLFQAKAIAKQGSVDNGNSVMDWDQFEIERKNSINLSVAGIALKNGKINLVDTPGFPDFIGDVISGLAVTETVISVVCAASGIQVQTLQTWQRSEHSGNARLVFINKLDRENSNYQKVFEELKAKFGADKIIPITIPIGAEINFKGVVDLISMKAYTEDKTVEIPADLKDEATSLRSAVMENIAGTDESLMNKYLESGELSSEEILKGISLGLKENTIIPVLCGCATKNIGIQQLLDLIISAAPQPKVKNSGTPSALIFKTINDPFIGKLSYFKVFDGSILSDTSLPNSRTGENEKGKIAHIFGKKLEDITQAVSGDIATFVKINAPKAGDSIGSACDITLPYPKPCHAVAIEVEVKGTEDKMANGLSKIVEDDPIMHIRRDPETKQTIFYGVGDTQTSLVLKKLDREFKVKVKEVELIVPYRETIQRKAHGDYKHKKQTGGAGQFAHVILDIEPMKRGEKYEFLNKVVGGNIPKQFIPAVEKGVIAAMEHGALAGFPVVDIRTLVLDGKYHPVDSNEMAFRTAGRGAFQEAQKQASPILLEPIYELKVFIPDEYTGDVMGDLNQRRGRVEGLESLGNGLTLIKAHVPYAEILRYTIDLKALTQGRGTFEMTFSNYEIVPSQQAQKVIEKYGKKAPTED